MPFTRKKIISLLLVSIFMLVGVFSFVNNVFAQVVNPVYTYDANGNPISQIIPQTGQSFILSAETQEKLKKEAEKNDNGSSPSTEGSIANIISWVLFYIATFFSWLVSLLVWVMVYVASYNNILTNQIVVNGWSIVRDVANNFFIVILLVIAVGTILRVPNYNRQLLPKLFVMAVLINFSKVFTGILIDFSQILTLWFAAAIQKSGGESGAIILQALGLHRLYELTSTSSVTDLKWTDAPLGLTPGTAMRVLFFAFILSVVAAVVVAVITIILVYRIVMLWFLVILSPLAFMLSTFPKGQSYSGMWWSELGKYLVVGPVMLFFLYLSLFSGAIITEKSINNPSGSPKYTGALPTGLSPISATDATNKLGLNDITSGPEGLFNYLIIVGLMVGSLVMGQKTGVAGAKWAGDGVGMLTKASKKYSGANLLQKGSSTLPGLVESTALRGAGELGDKLGMRRVPIIGSIAGQSVDQRRVKMATTKSKIEQEKITARSGALDLGGKDEKELRKIASDGDKYAKIAATQSMMKQGMFRDDDNVNRGKNIDLINNARKMLPAELASVFDDNTKKYNPGLAHDTVYKDKDNKFRADAFASDVRTGKVKAHEMMTALTPNQITDMSASLASKGHGHIGDFLRKNVSEKDLTDMNKNMTASARNMTWAGINKDSWTRDTAGNLTEEGKKERNSFNKITGYNNIDQTYDRNNQIEKDDMAAKIASDMAEIGKSMSNFSDEFVEDFGHVIKASSFKDRGPDIQENLKKKFEEVINGINDIDIDPTNTVEFKMYRDKIKNAMTSGAKFDNDKIDSKTGLVTDPRTGVTSNRELNFRKREIMKGIMSTASVKDVENMRGLNDSTATAQMELARDNININVVKGLSVSENGSVLASKIARAIKDEGSKPTATVDQKDRKDKLKDF